WHFEMRFAGNFDGPADVSGTRVFKPLFDSLRLEWTEVLDHSPVQGRGVVGFDGRSGRLLSSGVYSAGSRPECLMGTMDGGAPSRPFRARPYLLRGVRCGGIGRFTVNVAPCPTVERTSTPPPNMSRVIWLTTVSPVPEPEPNSRVVNPGSKMRSRCSAGIPTP